MSSCLSLSSTAPVAIAVVGLEGRPVGLAAQEEGDNRGEAGRTLSGEEKRRRVVRMHSKHSVVQSAARQLRGARRKRPPQHYQFSKKTSSGISCNAAVLDAVCSHPPAALDDLNIHGYALALHGIVGKKPSFSFRRTFQIAPHCTRHKQEAP